RRGLAALPQRRLLVSLSLSRRSARAAQGQSRQDGQGQGQNARQSQGQTQDFLTKRGRVNRLRLGQTCAEHLQLTNFSPTPVDVLLANLVNDYPLVPHRALLRGAWPRGDGDAAGTGAARRDRAAATIRRLSPAAGPC